MMKKSGKTCLLITIILLMGIIWPATSLAYEDASSRITIIYQHQNKYKNLTVPGSSYTVYDGGCGIFSIAHALQWLSRTKVTGQDEYDLIAKLVNLKLKTISSMTESLKTLVAADSGLVYHQGGMPVKTINNNTLAQNEALVKGIFDGDGVIITNPTGHYVVAVGYKYYNNKMYIQIIDSTAYSTIEPRGNLNLHIGYKYDSMAQITSGNAAGLQYWITSDCFFGKCSHDRKFRDWWWLSGYSTLLRPATPTSITLNQTVASLNLSEQLTLSVTAYPANATNSVTWTSSNNSVATVSNGVVTPLKAGQTVTITATSTADSSKSASCQVTVYYQGSDTLKFNGVKYPHTYNKNKAVTWQGTVESDVPLTSIEVNLYQGTQKYSQSASIPSGSKSYTMSNLGDNVFSKLAAGSFAFEVIATDSVGRRIAYSNNTCSATTSGNHALYDVPGSYSRPRLLGAGERNGHRYEVYENTSRDWETDRKYAIELGGHLATISDAAENEFVCDLVVSSGGTYGFLGGYYDSGWHWVDGTPFNYSAWNSDSPADGTLAYQPVLGLASAKTKTWGKPLKSNMMNFVVEYDPVKVSSIVLEGSSTMTVDDTQTLTWTVLPENAYNKAVTISTSNSACATVTNTGIVTAVGEGEAIIYAAAEDGSGALGQFHVYVQHKPIPVTGLSISADSTLYNGDKTIQLMVGQSAELMASITPANADDQTVNFYSSDSAVADFDGYGGNRTVIAKSAGSCRLWGTTSDNQISDYIDLVVVPVSGKCGDNATWVYQDGVLTISGTGAMYNSYEDSVNPPWLFAYKNSLTKVKVNSGITHIGNYAFQSLSALSSVSLPDSLTSIGYLSFDGCTALKSITLPDGITSMGAGVFANCSELTSIHLPNNISAIRTNWFLNCTKLTNVLIPEKVTTIQDCAFKNCQALTSISITDKVTSIGAETFAACPNLTITCIDGSAAHTYAQNNSIPYVIIGGKCGDNANWYYSKGELIISGTGDMMSFSSDSEKPWWDYRTSVNKIIISSGITSIGNRAFEYFEGLTDVSISSTVKTIGYRAFTSCTLLVNVSLPEGLESIERDAFATCYKLKNIILPSTLQSIGGMAFQSTAIESITIPVNVSSIADNPFCWTHLTSIAVSANNSSFKAIDGVLYSKDGKRLVAYPSAAGRTVYAVVDGTEIIDNNALYGIVNIQDITIPEGVMSLGTNSFYYNTSLQTLTLPLSLTNFGENVLAETNHPTVYCWKDSAAQEYAANNSLPYVIIGGQCGDDLTWKMDGTTLTISGTGDMYDYQWGDTDETVHVPWYVSYRDVITDVVFTGQITGIGDCAFNECTLLTNISIPDTVTRIGKNALRYCTSLRQITLPDSVAEMGSGVFSWCANLQSLTLPDSVTEIPDYLFYNCQGLTNVIIPANVSSIGKNNFNDSPDLVISCYAGSAAHLYAKGNSISYVFLDTDFGDADFTIPLALSAIESEAFAGIAARRVRLPENADSIGYKAFAACPNLVCIYIPEGCTSIAANAFEGVKNLTVFCQSGSYAEFYATRHNMDAVILPN